jgi:hypothetical protein
MIFFSEIKFFHFYFKVTDNKIKTKRHKLTDWKTNSERKTQEKHKIKREILFITRCSQKIYHTGSGYHDFVKAFKEAAMTQIAKFINQPLYLKPWTSSFVLSTLFPTNLQIKFSFRILLRDFNFDTASKLACVWMWRRGNFKPTRQFTLPDKWK